MDLFCKRAGIEVELDGASNGKELVEKVLGADYDLVFTDNVMPEVHGLQAIQQIRAQNKSVPIYMISSSEVGEQALKLGATGYLDKKDYGAFKSAVEKAIAIHLK